ncbi:MAG: hypothetical protein ACREJO_04850 [Phycisphaerales bacterium]
MSTVNRSVTGAFVGTPISGQFGVRLSNTLNSTRPSASNFTAWAETPVAAAANTVAAIATFMLLVRFMYSSCKPHCRSE